VVTVDLPGHGDDKTPIEHVSLQGYCDQVREVIARQTDPVVLVGHSMGGIVVSEVAEALPELVSHTVYLAAFLLRPGQTLWELTHPTQKPEQNFLGMTEELCGALYSDCDEETRIWASSKLSPEPIVPLRTPIHTTDARFGKVPRVYLECQQDRVISLSLQRRMIAAVPSNLVLSLETGHSPFLSAPNQLACVLASISSKRDWS
jgi:pimeloyl-ACP methyl ester carboxylesterase